MKLIRLLICLSLLVLGNFIPVYAQAAPRFGEVTITTPQLSRYDRFEALFELQTSASHLSLPYDPNPPPGLEAVSGVSVEALFTAPNGQTLRQPAFFFQPFSYSTRNDLDHFTPDGPPRWAVRFTPTQAGLWRLRLRAQDAGGETFYPARDSLSFVVQGLTPDPYRQRGFLRVSQSDRRYFEFDDGSPFTGVGYNGGFESIVQAAQRMPDYEAHKINFLRIWMSGSALNGSQWSPWVSQLGDDGYLPGVSLDTQVTYAGGDVSLRLDQNNHCFFAGWRQGPIPVEPLTSYRIWLRLKTEGLSGPQAPGEWGFAVKLGDWLGGDCDRPSSGRLLTPLLKGSSEWIELSGDLTTAAGQSWLGYLYLVRQNASAGRVYIDEVRLYRRDDPDPVNLLRQPAANSHLSFDSLGAARWDRYLELAEQHGVYLKLVIDEKNEWIRNRLTPNGQIGAQADNNNFYAAPGSKGRWLQEAWWRYLIARWGYSTAIHSFEYVNEGDPYNGNHHAIAAAMAEYFDQHDPAQHLVSTSFWAALPNKEFWSNPAFAAIDYADLHAYISTGWGADASFVDLFSAETNPAHVRSGNASLLIEGGNTGYQAITPRGLVLHEPGEWLVRFWMKAQSYSASCSYGTSGGQQRLRWLVDGGPFWGGSQGIVPPQAEGKDFICTSPAGSFDWQQFSSDRDRDGRLVPLQYRLTIPDDGLPHEITLQVENPSGRSGRVWIDDVELISPSGQVVPVIGSFDITPFEEDAAWFHAAYSLLHGASSPAGVPMPLVRGETGIDYPDQQDWQRALLDDTQGVWLHNLLWAQISPGGMYDLLWWAGETIDADLQSGRPDLYDHFLAFRNFMEDIPLNNGRYRQTQTIPTDPRLRTWGQYDPQAGRGHFWLQNQAHTWKAVVEGRPIPALNASVAFPEIPQGIYRLEWWNPYAVDEPVVLRQTVAAIHSLNLTLPFPLTSDLALKVTRINTIVNPINSYLPLVDTR